MTKLTKAQRQLLRQTLDQDAVVWLDMATEIRRRMFWKMVVRGYLYIRRDWEWGAGYGVIDVFDIITLTDKGHKAVRA